MNTHAKKIAGLVAGGVLVASAAPAAQLAMAEESAAELEGAANGSYAQEAVESVVAAQAQRTVAHVEGTFCWDQGVTASNETLAKSLYRSSDYLCGAAGAGASDVATNDAGPIESIKVTGDVQNAFTASVEEFTQKAPAKKVMGCTCSGNPADGLASANAEVSGFRLAALIEAAAPAEGANAITFTSRDGYQVALPLSYVTQRYSLIVTWMNGETASDAVGCANQLWLGSTAARAFARDVVEISITKEAEPPAAPGAKAEANVPNVGVVQGAAVA